MDTSENSGDGGVVTVTIPNPAAATSPSAQKCRTCKIVKFSGTGTFVNINADATATSFPMGTSIIDMDVQNLDELSFYGTAGDIVKILWRD